VLYPVELRDRDSYDSGSESGSQDAVTFLTSCLRVFIQAQSGDLEVDWSIQLSSGACRLSDLVFPT